MRSLSLARFYVQLIKMPQTGLLIFTAIAGYRSYQDGDLGYLKITIAILGLLFAISGATAMNMVFDRDIDSVMERTRTRPIPRGVITAKMASIFSLALIIVGLVTSFWISFLFGIVIAAGVFFNLIIYTLWLKRRSPWSIVFGGLAGGMPILAGRTLALGTIDWVGLLLALAILLWIPTHILTLAMTHSKDYRLAGISTFPNVFGFSSTRYFISISNLATGAILLAVFLLLRVPTSGIIVLAFGSLLLLIFSVKIIIHTSEKTNFVMFKYASLYMAGAMLILIL